MCIKTLLHFLNPMHHGFEKEVAGAKNKRYWSYIAFRASGFLGKSLFLIAYFLTAISLFTSYNFQLFNLLAFIYGGSMFFSAINFFLLDRIRPGCAMALL